MRNLKLLMIISLVLLLTLSGCKKKDGVKTSESTLEETTEAPTVEETTKEAVKEDGKFVSLEAYKANEIKKLNSLYNQTLSLEDEALSVKIKNIYQYKLSLIEEALKIDDLVNISKDFKEELLEILPKASGVYHFDPYDLEVISLLERYAYNNHLVGLPLTSNGQFEVFNERVKLGSNDYLPNYGFGLLEEGMLVNSLGDGLYKDYYHEYLRDIYKHYNYLNSFSSELQKIALNTNGIYFRKFMNAKKNGYDYHGELSIDNLPQNKEGNFNESDSWRFRIHVGDLKYYTNSLDNERKAFNEVSISAEDYLTPYKLLFTQANNLALGSSFVFPDDLVGAKDYYDNSLDGYNEEAFKKVGVKVYEEAGSWYLDFKFNRELSMEEFMKKMNNPIFSPIPEAFINLVGISNFGNYSTGMSPVDNVLACGPYSLLSFNEDEIVIKKNPNYKYAKDKFIIPGITYKRSIKKPLELFKDNLIDSTLLSENDFKDFINHQNLHLRKGDFIIRLNINSMTKETYEEFFGENGSISQTPQENYYALEPIMSNDNFLKGLSFSINRSEYALKRGTSPTVNFLDDSYMLNEATGLSYNNSVNHDNNLRLTYENASYGYDLAMARNYFRLALEEVVRNGEYKLGTKENPTTIKLELGFMHQGQEEEMFNDLKTYFEEAFNDLSVTQGLFKLECKFYCGKNYNGIFEKMMKGEFDLGYGETSSSNFDKLTPLKNISTDVNFNEGFIKNYHKNTNQLNDILIYHNELFTYDALLSAFIEESAIKDGKLVHIAEEAELKEVESGSDGSKTYEISVKLHNEKDYGAELISVLFYSYSDENYYSDYDEVELIDKVRTNGKDDLVITLKLDKDFILKYQDKIHQGFDVSFNIRIGNTTYEIFYSLPIK